METELKLAIAARDIAALMAHPLLAAVGAPQEVQQRDVYYDTPQHSLWQQGFGLRVRSAGGRHVQTLKDAGAAVGGLHVRGEWEAVLADGRPDPALLARQLDGDPRAGALFTPALALQPVFTIAATRTLWQLRLDGGCDIECVLDVGAIRCGKRRAAIAEVELELQRGDPAQLMALALELGQAVPLRIDNRNKAERGYALLGAQRAPAPAYARPVQLAAGATLDDALHAILASCLHQMEANVAGVLLQDAECLHQMRVGLRRLRAALGLFRRHLHLPAELQQDLAWLSAVLGKARNWDVFGADTVRLVGGADWHTGRQALRAAAAAHAAASHQAVRRALHAQRYTRLVLGLARWLTGRAWRAPADGVRPDQLERCARNGIAPLLKRTRRRLAQRLERADPADAASLHRVRIAAKQARYAAEFFASLLPPKPLKKHVQRLAALQEVLGSQHDLAVAKQLLAELLRDPAPPATHIAYADGYLAALGAARLKAVRKSLKRAGAG